MPNETQLSFDQPRSAFGTWLGVVLLFAVFGLFVWVVVGLMPRGDDYEAKRAEARVGKLKTIVEEGAPLETYGWVDKAKGVAHIPIHRAMELTMAELAQKKPAPGAPIEAPVLAPSAPAPGAAAATPAVMPSPASSPVPAVSHAGPGSVVNGQPAAAANPRDAAPGTQPGPNATPAASSPPPSGQIPAPLGQRGPTPVQSAPGTPLPVPGATP
ncbi:MAG: hypothetical protein ABI992_03435 [Chthoniobacterales bacterium]